MGLFDKVKETTIQAKNATEKFVDEKGISDKISSATDSFKKTYEESTSNMRAFKEESKNLKKPLEGAYARYEFTYISGLEDIPKAKTGAWGMNIMPDMFSFRVTMNSKDWLYDLDLKYDDITDIRIEKRTISTAEVFLGGGNDPNQEQENVVVIEYIDANNRNQTLRIEMLTGVTIFNQAAKCRELFDLLKRENILNQIKKSDEKQTNGNDVLSQIEKLAKLKDAGILTEEEFDAKKTELLVKL